MNDDASNERRNHGLGPEWIHHDQIDRGSQNGSYTNPNLDNIATLEGILAVSMEVKDSCRYLLSTAFH